MASCAAGGAGRQVARSRTYFLLSVVRTAINYCQNFFVEKVQDDFVLVDCCPSIFGTAVAARTSIAMLATLQPTPRTSLVLNGKLAERALQRKEFYGRQAPEGLKIDGFG